MLTAHYKRLSFPERKNLVCHNPLQVPRGSLLSTLRKVGLGSQSKNPDTRLAAIADMKTVLPDVTLSLTCSSSIREPATDF